MTDGTDAAVEGSAISLPKGGGALSGLGETFSPDAFTGTGNVAVPIALPPGRLGLRPQLSLAYTTGIGNGPFGIGWQLGVPGVARKTSRGLPRYLDAPGPRGERADVFVLAGAEDLVPVDGAYPGRVRYRPRTEGLFARIEHIRAGGDDYWEVRGADGMISRYGTARPAGSGPSWRDPAAVADPDDTGRVFGWRLTETRDPLGNLIRYEYTADHGRENGHRWDQPLLARISYADYGDRAAPSFLVTVDFDYEPRPDPYSEHRAGFEIRTTVRCQTIRVATHAADGVEQVSREYRLGYTQAAFNGTSLLSRVDTVGIDAEASEALPPLTFGYTRFDAAGRRFTPLTGPGLPASSLTDPSVALVDLRGVGLPDVVELGAARRVWRNDGAGRFGLARTMAEAPPHALIEPGVRLMDADGDGRIDLIVPPATPGGATGGFYPMSAGGGWDRASFRRYRRSPSVSLADPRVRLVDLDGDGLTDLLRSGSRLQCWFNDPDPALAWQGTAVTDAPIPGLDLADPRVRLADMTGDGLQDLVLLQNGNIAYWPNLGYGRWGDQVSMRGSPRLPDGHDPRRILLGDVDGDGAADLVYADRGRVLLWGNQSGNGWTEQPVAVPATPVVDSDGIQLSDLHGTGMAGLLLTPAGGGRPPRFLDFTGGVKPYLLDTMDNHLGAVTRVTYTPSTVEFLRDQADPATRWRTTLPFPVHVVATVEVADAISGGRLTTVFRYHHGYWDGIDREFRGFAMVERSDAETLPAPSDGTDLPHAPPVLTKTWFHPGPVAGAEAGDWTELDLSHEYWPGDPGMLTRPPDVATLLAALPRAARRSALRTLRGQVLRTEVYGVDGTDRADRPYTVTEAVCGVREESPPPPAPDGQQPARERIFFPMQVASRNTQYERGTDPMTRFDLCTGYDRYGCESGLLAVAVPRGRDPLAAATGPVEPYPATYVTTGFARRDDDGVYLVDRVCRATTYEVVNDGSVPVADLFAAVLAGGAAGVSLRLIGDSRTYFDGDAFTGLPLGTLGEHGLPVRAECLAFTDAFLAEVFDPADPRAITTNPTYLRPDGPPAWPDEYPPEFRAAMPTHAGYRYDADTGGYYIATARHRYDVHVPGRTPRGLSITALDPLGGPHQVEYDAHEFLPVRAVDAAGLATTAVHDYRTLQAYQVTDPNGSVGTVRFSPLGLVTARYVRGQAGEGDRDQPSTRMTYDLLAYAEHGRPVSVRTERRVYHDTDGDAPADHRDDVVVAVEFSDGFGRRLQTRTLTDDTLLGDPIFGGGVLPAADRAPVGDTIGRLRPPGAPDNVVVSGWQVYDNKGRVIHRYEPFFATGFDFGAPLDAQLGQRKTMFYDPLGRAVRTVNPDRSEQRAVFGIPAELDRPDTAAPSPWEIFTYDANDNAGRTHGDLAVGYRDHWDTPSSVELDALGHQVRAVSRAGPSPAQWLTTRSRYDIRGNLLAVVDAGRTAFTSCSTSPGAAGAPTAWTPAAGTRCSTPPAIRSRPATARVR